MSKKLKKKGIKNKLIHYKDFFKIIKFQQLIFIYIIYANVI